MMSYLFVYGTLMPGEKNHHYVSSIEGSWHEATVRGTLFPNGIGKAQGYPALILHERADLIHGYVLNANELDKHWQRLDEFEGEAYNRVITSIELNNNKKVNAYVYVLAESVEHE